MLIDDEECHNCNYVCEVRKLTICDTNMSIDLFKIIKLIIKAKQ